jgi:hypothetical protein
METENNEDEEVEWRLGSTNPLQIMKRVTQAQLSSTTPVALRVAASLHITSASTQIRNTNNLTA